MDNIIEGVKSNAIRMMVYMLLAVLTTLFYSWLSMVRMADKKKRLARQIKIERRKIYKKVKIKKIKTKNSTVTGVNMHETRMHG